METFLARQEAQAEVLKLADEREAGRGFNVARLLVSEDVRGSCGSTCFLVQSL